MPVVCSANQGVGNMRFFSSSKVVLWIGQNLEFIFALDYYLQLS